MDATTRLFNLLFLSAILSFIYLLALTFYNIFLHPLRNVPGPPLARLSKLWSRYGNLKGRKSHRIHEAHLKYGNVVRVAPNELSFADPKAVRDIYFNEVFVKETTFYRAKRVFHEEMLMSFRDPEAHKQRKKLLQRGFSQASMFAFEPQIDDKISAILDQWSKRASGGPIDILPWLHWLAFDIVYHLMFDEDPGSVKQGEPHWIMASMKAWRQIFVFKEFVPQLEQWGTWLPGYVGGYFRKVESWKKFASDLIRSCRTRDTKTPFLNTALTGTDAFLGRPLTDSELAEESMGGMFAGSGTTAHTVIYLLWATLRRPELVKRLREELQAEFGAGAQAIPSAAVCAKLPLLQAIIDETLRVYPMAVATLPRTAVYNTSVCGMHIPAGTIVGTQNYTIHQNEAAFPNPTAFEPDRWLDSKNSEVMKQAFTPFGVGSRACIGTSLARMEMNKLTAAFFLRFEAHVDSSMTEEQMEMYDVFTASPKGGRFLVNMRELERGT